MKLFKNLAQKGYDKIFMNRCDIRPGIHYFDETHFKGLIKENFEFKNSNGFFLRGGIYHFDKYDKDTLIIFCHGMGGGHQAYMKEIAWLAKNNYQVLAIDYQGTILSEGDSLNGPTQALKDMGDVVESIKNNYKNIIVIGHSWGGWVAQGLTYIHPEIKKVITLAGMNSLPTLCQQYFPWFIAFIRKYILQIEIAKYPDLALSSAMINLNRSDLSALVIQSKDDSLLHFKYNYALIKKYNTNPNVKFIEVDHKNHNPHYCKESVDYLTKYLHQLDQVKSIKEADELGNQQDWDKMTILDEDIMNAILDFIKQD